MRVREAQLEIHAFAPIAGADPKHEPRNVMGAGLVAINDCVREVRAARPLSTLAALRSYLVHGRAIHLAKGDPAELLPVVGRA